MSGLKGIYNPSLPKVGNVLYQLLQKCENSYHELLQVFMSRCYDNIAALL